MSLAESGLDPSLETTVSPGRMMRLDLVLDDPEVIAELRRLRDPDERARFAREALRLGVLALRMASGHVDVTAIRDAGKHMVTDVRTTFDDHAKEMSQQLGEALASYFHPKTGMLQGRLEGLFKRDGQVERLLDQHVGETSVLAQTLAEHVGQTSPIFKLLSPTESDGLMQQIETMMDSALTEQRDQMLAEFSLDREDSALSRLCAEVSKGNVEMKAEFSLDRPDSALSRLVTRVEVAGRNLSLDDDDSALSRLRREVMEPILELREMIAAMQSRREEADRSTRHGTVFEDELGSVLAKYAQQAGDVHEPTGMTTGQIKACKKGDHVITLGPESSAPGVQIVWEAKESKSWNVRKALEELEQARKNRRAQLGVFVFSKKTAPDDLEAFQRYGPDIIVVWDAEDPETDLVLQSAYSVTKALAHRDAEQADASDEAVDEIDRATRGIEKQLTQIEAFEKNGQTIVRSAEKIVDGARKARKNLTKEIEKLDEQIAGLKGMR